MNPETETTAISFSNLGGVEIFGLVIGVVGFIVSAFYLVRMYTKKIK